MYSNLTWDERFEFAKAYYEHHGHLRVVITFKTKDGYSYDKDGFKLGKWISRQRYQHKIKELTPVHYEKLKSIGMIFEDLNKLDWETFYNLAQVYLEHHRQLPGTHDFKTKNGYEYDKDGKNLGAWFHVQRLNYNNNTLSQERMEKMDRLFKKFNQIQMKQQDKTNIEWDKMYELAKAYYEYYGRLNMPIKFSTKNGYDYDKKGKNLGVWIREQRQLYRRGLLTEEQIKKLEQIKMVFSDMVITEWERMYTLAKIYYEYHGNLKVPRQFKTKNGYEYDKDGSNLGKWVNTQYCRNIKGSISKEEYEKLIVIGMVFENQKGTRWDKMYELAQKYYEHHGNLNVLSIFKTKNGYEYDEQGENLGFWISTQRKYYLENRISKNRIEKLKQIGMVFENLNDVKWDEFYELAKVYYSRYGNLLIDINFITQNGYDYDKNGKRLGGWINRQRTDYRSGNMSSERIKKLKIIGMIFESLQDREWNKMYALALAYYQYYNNLKIRADFRTENGYDYDSEGEKLGQWINAQRTAYKKHKLTQERFEKLQIIGMIFEIKKDKEQNQITCITYNINYEKHKKAIDAIPHREFIAKINYLSNQGLPFVIENQLHPIFSMSSVNMEVRYGISLEHLIEEYQQSLKKVKKV